MVIRTRMDQVRMTGRSAQGVSVINVPPGDSVASLATIEMGGGPPGGGGGKGGPGGDDDSPTQPPLTGLDDGAPRGRGRRPTPILGKQPRASAPRAAATAKPKAKAPAKPAPRPAARTAATRPAARPAAKPAPRRASTARRGPKPARLKGGRPRR
jgi:hypothetical protein